MSEKLVLSIRNLCKVYKNGKNTFRALNNVCFDVNIGEMLSITGTSGSGKTTLLNIIGSLDTDFEGSVRVYGKDEDQIIDISRLSDTRISRFRARSIGFVFQHFNLLPHLSCLENIMLPSVFVPRKDAEKRAQTLLENMGLSDKARSYPSRLSGGQQQRIAIARALFNEPSLLCCDEPTGSLDSENRAEILQIFKQINNDFKTTLLLITHDEYVSQVCMRNIRLEDGSVVSDSKKQAHGTF